MTSGDHPTGETALLDRPVGDVLDDLGLPRTPAPLDVRFPDVPGIDLPALPALPGLDPTTLVKPIIDLLGTFGTGRITGAGNPVDALTGLSGVLDAGVSTLLKAVSAVDGQWLGRSAASAIAKATATAAESGAVSAQGAAMVGDVQVAAGIVGAGATALQGVIAKTVGLLAATAPTLATPPGQLAALGIAADGLAQGLAIVAATRAQLAPVTAKLAATGAVVPVGSAPTPGGVLSGDALSGLLGKVGPLMAAGQSLAGSLLSQGPGATPSAPSAPGPATAGTKGAACCTSCTPSTTASGAQPDGTQPEGRRPDGKPGDVQPAATGSPTSSGAGPSGAVPSVSVPDQPIRLADCPTTSNATTVAAAPGSVVESSVTTAPAAATPMAPFTTAGALRGAEPTALRTVESTIVAAAQPPDTSDADLAALLAQPFGVDVDLRITAGTADLAESV